MLSMISYWHFIILATIIGFWVVVAAVILVVVGRASRRTFPGPYRGPLPPPLPPLPSQNKQKQIEPEKE